MANVSITAKIVGFDTMQRALAKSRAGLDRIGKRADALAKKLKKTGDAMTAFGKKATLFVTAPLLAAGVAATKFASDLEESQNKAQEVFGASIQVVDAFARTSAEAFGIAKSEALEYTSTLGTILAASGLAQDATASMSVELTKLAADLASFNNIPIDVALEKIRAGLVGEVEPLRTVGVLLNANAVAQKAVELGLVASTKELTEAAKVQARFALILEATETAQGDFSRTSDSLANSLRIAKAQLIDAAAALGQSLIPIATKAVRIVQSLTKQFTEMGTEAQERLLVVSALVGAGGPVIVGIGFLAQALSGLISLFRTLALATSASVAPFVLAATAGAALVTIMMSLGVVVFSLGQALIELRNPLEVIGENFKGLADEMERGLSRIGGSVSRFVANTKKKFFGMASSADVGLERFQTAVAARIDATIANMSRLPASAFDKAAEMGRLLAEGFRLTEDEFILRIPPEALTFTFKIQKSKAERDADELSLRLNDLAKNATFGLEQLGNVEFDSPAFKDMQAQIDDVIARMRELSPEAADAMQKMADDFIAGLERPKSAWKSFFDDLAVTMEDWADLASAVMDEFSQGVGDAVAGAIVFGEDLGKSMEKVFQNLAATIISTLIQLAIQELASLVVSQIFAAGEVSAKAGASAGTVAAKVFEQVIDTLPWPANVAAAPGAAAAAAASLIASASAATAAGEGVGAAVSGAAQAGLEEIPQTGTFLLHRGERVLAAEQNRDLMDFLSGVGRGTGAGLPITVSVDARGAVFDDISMREFSNRIAKDIARESRRF